MRSLAVVVLLSLSTTAFADLNQNNCAGLMTTRNADGSVVSIFHANLDMTETKDGIGQVSIAYDSGVKLKGEIQLKRGEGWKLSATGEGPSSGHSILVSGDLNFAVGLKTSRFVFEGESVFTGTKHLTGIFECTNPL